ncbi:MAG TPA: hypothetical protein PK624_09275 [Spirochaetota bacterium]|nr:hypothetical protein [Spirochaetota bacterium]HOR44974.1 hypothetical protein [Spirochaetota bacterium]HPK56699.1 hypothetical protein [Spirochaetota bacterium]
MKTKIFIAVLSVLVATFAIAGNPFKKAVQNTTVDDIKKVADLIDMSFGDGPDGPFKVSPSKSEKPVLIIQNDTDRTITVTTKGPTSKTFVVKSNKTESAKMESGDYHFTASAPETKGCEGDAGLDKFKEYKWVFYIKK